MAKFSININWNNRDFDKMLQNIAAAGVEIAAGVLPAMAEAAFAVEAAAKRQLTSGPNRAIDTGFLRASIGVSSLLPFKATVTAFAAYGGWIHEGKRVDGRTGRTIYVRVGPRPYMTAAVTDSQKQIEGIFGKRISTMIQFA